MEHLQHNGILVPPRYEGKGLTVKAKGKKIKLTPEQEEMAVAWAKKMGTHYVEDRVFAKNFHCDFSQKLGIKVKVGDIDYSEVVSFVENERDQKASLSREARKKLAARRKAEREANKKRYGYAWVDGVQIDVANYAAEPSSIFMGRGKHPLRGRWKEGPRQTDIELNLSPDSRKPKGNWKDIIWQPEAMWIARWRDKLSGKIKYVWFSDSSILRQQNDIEKFDTARELRKNLTKVEKHILDNLNAADIRRKKTATVCYLIDKLRIRVGDEKDVDEADTVGASTLRPQHVRFNDDATVTFNFLGKDSVPHVFKVELPENVIQNLKEFAANTDATLFDGIGSKHVSEFLDEVMAGLSAKVFRTCYASETVETKLDETPTKPEDPEYIKKYIATMANLEAAKICNHRRTIPKNWKTSLEKKMIRLKLLNERAKKAQAKLQQKASDQKQRFTERLQKQKKRLSTTKEKLDSTLRHLADKRQQGKHVQAMKKRSARQRRMVQRQKQRLKELKTKRAKQKKKLKQKLASRELRDNAAIDKLKFRILTQKKTREHNLITSLKSYIDPRIYFEWGKKVEYSWTRYYPKALQKKFNWVNTNECDHI